MQISEFKAKCLKILKEIKEPLIISSRGESLVVIYPYSELNTKREIGIGAGMIICGDIIKPSGEWNDWEK